VRPSNHSSTGALCIDLQKFTDELQSKAKKVRKIEVGKILDRVVLEKTTGQSPDERPTNHVYPLLNVWDNPGRFVRLARFWELAQKDLSEDEYEELLKPMLQEHRVIEQDLLRPLAQFMKVVENIQNNSFVHALQIESFQLTPQWNKDDYTDAIAPDEFNSRWEAFAFVNLLGNCSLLDKSFNISKSDQPMWSFLQEVHEFKEGKFNRQDCLFHRMVARRKPAHTAEYGRIGLGFPKRWVIERGGQSVTYFRHNAKGSFLPAV